ncbi:AAA family ATPase [Tranquillimonas alkanivorans]|uniref:Chromosome partitioning protein n=1 Tax=Tranquillimonas alkanivorans TaxID=441119 RepID=A0A1I5VYQ2_9RHOB|nr:ParA family protein [Tranquillimonas alkanivorans]SFQ12467.1 chromosome partitioning protein [Tranquillimonas alkanivorans]
MLETFVRSLTGTMLSVNTRLQRDLTRKERVTKRFSIRETAQLLGLDSVYLTRAITRLADEEPGFRGGERVGRERLFGPDELMELRAILHTNRHSKRPYLHWRQPGEPLRVVTFGAQKGGTGKSLSAAHFAQYVSMNYGLRVGVIDCDPQATVSLYFADNELPLFSDQVDTAAEFMGISEPTQDDFFRAPANELDAMWRSTPWPGIRLLPGGASIQSADIFLFLISQKQRRPIYFGLKDALSRWDAKYGPKTRSADLRKADGTFDKDVFRRAMTETLDLIVIDQQPALTLMQLNGLIAADSVIIPQTVKGFDLSTLTTYASSILSALEELRIQFPERADEIGLGNHVVLPTIVSHDKELEQIMELYGANEELFAQVYYPRSDAISNAADEYKSIYEYNAPRSRRASAKKFTEDANIVNDFLVTTVLPELPSRGYAQDYIEKWWAA